MDSRSPWVAIRDALIVALALTVALPISGRAASVSMILDKTIEVFRVGDFDPSDTAFHPQIFTLMLTGDDPPIQARLRMEITTTRFSGSAGGVASLATGTTKEFTLDPGVTVITNRDLTEESETGTYSFPSDGYDISSEADELEDLVLELGYLPEARYCFKIELLDAGLGLIGMAEDCLIVTNPFDMEIIRPGAPFGDDLPRVMTANPQFQWNSRAVRWRIKIAAAEPGDGSGEDVLEHISVYSSELRPGDPGVFGGGSTGTVSWSYPSAAEDLRRGGTYCWMITAFLETSGGTEEISSDIFCFRRWDPSDVGAEPIVEALAGIMSELIAAVGAELEGMSPTGVVLVNGAALSPAEVQEIMDAIASGELEILDAYVE